MQINSYHKVYRLNFDEYFQRILVGKQLLPDDFKETIISAISLDEAKYKFYTIYQPLALDFERYDDKEILCGAWFRLQAKEVEA